MQWSKIISEKCLIKNSWVILNYNQIKSNYVILGKKKEVKMCLSPCLTMERATGIHNIFGTYSTAMQFYSIVQNPEKLI